MLHQYQNATVFVDVGGLSSSYLIEAVNAIRGQPTNDIEVITKNVFYNGNVHNFTSTAYNLTGASISIDTNERITFDGDTFDAVWLEYF